MREIERRWAAKNPDTVLAAYLRRTYGIALEVYTDLLTKQNGVCAICQQPETYERNGKIGRLCLDHDHQTGKIRGLLCHKCNVGIAALKESPEVMRAAAKYMEVHNVSREL